ncbi:uncharacterized protein V1477_006187 [Vespula maculifrons]|uniref:Hornerin-like n=1 Tax=Vespula maculifrons TaxID=7453 RepID=A0ABD2CJR3_VESMC
MDNMFSSDNIYLRCYFFVIFFATTYAAPGGLGSFAGSNSAAFSSASANAYAGSVASAISSANAFTGGTFPSKNPDGTYGLSHQEGTSAGSGSYVGLGSINPDSNKFGSPHQAFGTKGSYNDNKSQTVCSGCPNVKEKWELDNYDDQSEEEPQEEEEEDDCDDGQYRPEHHYHHHKSKVDKKQEQQTVSSVHKIGNNDQYNYNQSNDKDGYTTSDNKGQENIHDGRYNNYGNSGHVGANNQNLNNNYNAYQHNTGALKDSLHPSSSWTDINKKKENENKNSGNSGVVTPTSPNTYTPTIGKNYGNTNIGATGGITPSQINLGLTRGTNADCSNTKSGSRANCVESIADSNSNQAPVKLSQSNIKKTINVISSEGNRATTECNNLHGNCDNSKTGETAQYQSTSIDSTNNLQNGYTDSTGKKNKPHSYDQEKTGQWRDQPNKGNLPSGPAGNVGAGSGCRPGVSSPICSNEASTLQKNTPIPTQTYGTAGSGPSNVGVGNKPHSYDQPNTGQWRDQPNKGNLPNGPAGNVGAGSGCTPGVSSPACSNEASTLQKNTPIPTQTYGTVGSGPSNVGVGNKPHSYDQQNTGQWRNQPNKGNLPNGPAGNVGAGSGCTPGVSSPACSNEASTLQKNTPIPTQTYGTVDSGPSNVGVGNKPHSYDQQNTGQWRNQPNKGNLPNGPSGNVGAGSGCTPGVSSPACSNEASTLQKNTPIPTQTYGTVGNGPSNVGVGYKPHSYDQQNIGQWRDQPNKGNLPSGPAGNVGAGSGCTPGVSSPACSNEASTLQKNTPIPTQTYGTAGSGPSNVGVGNKPHSYDQQNTGQWRDQPNKGNLPSGPAGNVGAGSGCTPGVSSPACSNEASTLQKNTPIPTQTYGTAGSGPSNVGVGNKPHSYDQQNTGQWRDQPNKGNLPSGPAGNVGAGSGCTPGVSSPACSNEASTLQKNTPIPTQTYGTAGSGPSNVGVGNKPHSYDQQNTGQWRDQPNKGNLPSGPAGNVGAGSGCTPGVSSPACSNEASTLQKNTPIPTQTYGTAGSGPSNVGVGNKPHSYDQQNTGQWRDQPNKGNLPSGPAGNVGAGSGCTPGVSSPACSNEASTLQKNTPIPTQTYGTAGSGPSNVGVGNKPHSYDQQNTGPWRDQPNKGNLPSGPAGNVGAGSGCTPGVSSPACSNEASTLQKNTPIPTQTYGTAGNGPSNVGVGNKPHSYDQQNTGQWRDQPNKGNLPSGPAGNVGAGSGCTPGVSSPACSNEASTLQKNTPIPTQTYGTAGSGPSNVGVGNKPHSYDQQNTGPWRDQPNKGNLPSGPAGNVGAGSGCTPGVSSPACSNEASTLQKNTPIPTQTYGTAGSGPSNVGVGNKPHSYDQQNTGQWRDQPNKGNLPSGPAGNVGAGSGCTPGVSSPACSNEASTLQKNTPIPTQIYGTIGSGPSNVGVTNKPHSYDQQNTGQWRDQPNKSNLPSGPASNVGAGSGCTSGGSSICTSEIPSVQKNIPTSSYTFGTVATGPYQSNKDTKQSGNCGAFSSSTCVGRTEVPIGSSQKIDDGIGSGHNVHGQTNSGNKNSYPLNAGNPFLHGGQDNLKPFIHTTSSPIFITNNVDSVGTTSKPIGFGNPFLDGTIGNTFGTEHDKHNTGINPIKSDPLNKPIGTGNPFLTNSGNGGSKSSTPIYSGASIGSISSPSILPSVTTVLPIGQNNPFLEVSGGNVVNKYPPGVYPSVAENNKNVFSGSGTPANKEFPKSGVGITSSGSNPNTNRGVKGGNQHNKIFENVATSNAGALSTGNVDTDKSTGLNIPNAYNNNNNVGHGASSLPGTANINKPSYTLSTSPESYGHKDTLPRTSGSDSATNGNGNSPSNSLINGHNANGPFNPQITNAGAQSFAGAHAGSFASSFSSSQASSSSSSFASSKSGSYTANGDPNVLHQLNRNWPFDIATSVSGASSWPSLNAGSHASAFASSSAGSWSGSEPIGVKS